MAEERIDIVITERGSRVVKRNLEDIGDGARKSADGVEFLKKALKTLGAAITAGELIRLLDTFTNLQNRLRATGLESQNLSAVYRELLSVANSTRQSFEGTVETYGRLANSAKEMGLSQQELIDFTKSLNQAIALSGASATEAQAAMIQLAQGMASGVLRGDELNSVLEQLPIVADVIAQQLGVTRGQLREMGSEGKITADIIFAAFQNARGELEERFGKAVPTIGQSFQVLKNNIIDMAGSFDQATGASAAISRVLLAVSENLDTISKVALSAVSGLALVGGTASAINLARNAMLALNAAIAANPVGFLLTVLTSAITALTLFRDQINLGADDVTTLGDMLRALGEIVGAVFSTIRQWAQDTFGPLIQLIEDWVGEVDVSIVDILNLVAKGVDTYIGAWRGAIAAVVALFDGLPAALGDLMTRALNVLLEKIGNFVNAAGELLSKLTEFAGLGKIAAIDLRITNENEGAARKLGQNIGAAFSEGFNSTNYAQDFIKTTVSRAQQIGRERVAAQNGPAPDLGQRGGASQITAAPGAEATKKAAEATSRLQEELNYLVGSYDRVWSAQREYENGVRLLEKAESEGLITEKRKAEVIALMEAQLKDAMDPLGALNRELEREGELLKMTSDQREVENQLRAIQQDLLRQGVALNDQELDQLRERLELLQSEVKAHEQRNDIIQKTTGSQKEFMDQLETINKLIKEGAISKDQATTYLVQQNKTLFEGTIEQQKAFAAQYQQTLSQIDAMRKADLISEQSASQMKEKAAAEMYANQLKSAAGYFGKLTALSKSENRTLAAIGKAVAITQAVIYGVLAVQKALASAAPPVNYAIAAAVSAQTAANVAKILGVDLGFQTGGSFVVGGTGGPDSQMVAFRATPGEKVSVARPEQVRKGNPYEGAGQMPAPQLNARIINVLDPAVVGDYLSTSDGEQVLVNVLRRNSDSIRTIVKEG